MTIENLRKKYSESELSSIPGDNELRYKAFAPLFRSRSLHDGNKVVYHCRVTVLARLVDVVISGERLSAKLDVIQFIGFKHSPTITRILREHGFGGSWSRMRLVGSSVNVPYASWSVWPEKHLVKEVEDLLREGRSQEVLENLNKDQ